MTQAEKKKSTTQTSTSHSTGQGKQARKTWPTHTGVRAGQSDPDVNLNPLLCTLEKAFTPNSTPHCD
jgi:hypothetical protein